MKLLQLLDTKISILLILVLFSITAFGYITQKKFFTPFELTAFVAFGYLDHIKNKEKSISKQMYKNPKMFFETYILLVLGTFICDRLFGIILGAWSFPNYNLFDHILTVFIGYTAAGFSFIYLINILTNRIDEYSKRKTDKLWWLAGIFLIFLGFVTIFFLNVWYALTILST